jgi:hypothetical protein
MTDLRHAVHALNILFFIDKRQIMGGEIHSFIVEAFLLRKKSRRETAAPFSTLESNRRV